jgi:tetratricopeptide (TPR) repeat protein
MFKQLVLVYGVGAVALLYGLSMLQTKRVATAMPLSIVIYILFIVVAFLSAFFSNQPADAMRGFALELGTVLSFVSIGIALILPLFLQRQRAMLLIGLGAVMLATLLLAAIGVTALLTPITAVMPNWPLISNAIGSLNDMAVLLAALLAGALVLVSTLRLGAIAWCCVLVCTALAILVIGLVQFEPLWFVLGGIALTLLLFQVSRLNVATASWSERIGVLYVLLITIICGLFLQFGSSIATGLVSYFGVEYADARPSIGTTIDIARSVYQEQPVLGIGPNQFSDAWRLYKDPDINQFAVWNTDFTGGYSLITTIFVTTGLLGGSLFVIFQAAVAAMTIRLFAAREESRSQWRSLSFIALAMALLLWLMTFLYVPSMTLLLLTAVLTGYALVTRYQATQLSFWFVSVPTFSRPVTQLVTCAMLLLFIVSYGLYSRMLTDQFRAVSTYTTIASQLATDATTFNEAQVIAQLNSAYAQYQHPTFQSAQASIVLEELNQLLTITDPTEADQAAFTELTQAGLAAASAAIASNSTEPAAYITQAQIYSVLNVAGVLGALDRATTSMATAKLLDPLDPSVDLALAQIHIQDGDQVQAMAALDNALALKPNYVEALNLLVQMHIASDNVAEAIINTQTIIQLEPNNPARYYQLGLLHRADSNTEAAIAAFDTALSLNSEFADARFLRAVTLAEIGQTQMALTELAKVSLTNPDNAFLQNTITQIENSLGGDQFLGGTTSVPTVSGASPIGIETFSNLPAEIPLSQFE